MGRALQSEESASWWGSCTLLRVHTLLPLHTLLPVHTLRERCKPSGKEQLRRPRCKAKRVPLGREGALVQGAQPHPFAHPPPCTHPQGGILREEAAAAAVHVIDPPKADAALQSSEGALVEGAPPPPCAHTQGGAQTGAGRCSATGAGRCTGAGWCTAAHLREVLPAQANHAHVLHSCAVMRRLYCSQSMAN